MIKNIIKLLSGTLISRLFGFIREVVYASLFGASYFMDIWIVASNIPNLFREILGEKVVESIFIPSFHRVKEKLGLVGAKKFTISIFIRFIFALLSVFLLLNLFLKNIIHFFAPGLPPNYLVEAVSITKITLYYTILIGISAFLGAFLLIKKQFFKYSISPAIANIVHVIFILIFYHKLGKMTLPYAFLFSGLTMVLSNGIFAFLSNRDILFVKDVVEDKGFNKELKKESSILYLQSIPIFFEMVFNKLSSIVDRRLASFLIEGSISSLYYSFRLIQLPFALVALAINRVVMVDFSKSSAENNLLDESYLAKKGFMLNLLIIIFVVVFYLLFSKEIITIIYKRGKFDINDVKRVSFVMNFYSIGLIAMALNSLFTRLLYIKKSSRAVMIHSIVSLSINIILNYLLYDTRLQVGGIALATSISFFINMILNWRYLYLKHLKLNFFKGNYYILISIIPLFFSYFFISSLLLSKIIFMILTLILLAILLRVLKGKRVI